MTLSERIEAFVEKHFTWNRAGVVRDLVDVATGNREGNPFERDCLARIFGEEYVA